MQTSSQFEFEQTIQHQFDYVARKTIIRAVYKYYNNCSTHYKNYVPFSDLSEDKIKKFCTTDKYKIDEVICKIDEQEIFISEDLLAEALKMLSDKKRNIILLFYFGEMSDKELSRLHNVNRSTIYRQRMDSLKDLKKILERKGYNG